MIATLKRRDFISLLGGAAATVWPFAARAQQSTIPVVGCVSSRSLDGSARHAAAFTKGLEFLQPEILERSQFGTIVQFRICATR